MTTRLFQLFNSPSEIPCWLAILISVSPETTVYVFAEGAGVVLLGIVLVG